MAAIWRVSPRARPSARSCALGQRTGALEKVEQHRHPLDRRLEVVRDIGRDLPQRRGRGGLRLGHPVHRLTDLVEVVDRPRRSRDAGVEIPCGQGRQRPADRVDPAAGRLRGGEAETARQGQRRQHADKEHQREDLAQFRQLLAVDAQNQRAAGNRARGDEVAVRQPGGVGGDLAGRHHAEPRDRPEVRHVGDAASLVGQQRDQFGARRGGADHGDQPLLHIGGVGGGLPRGNLLRDLVVQVGIEIAADHQERDGEAGQHRRREDRHQPERQAERRRPGHRPQCHSAIR